MSDFRKFLNIFRKGTREEMISEVKTRIRSVIARFKHGKRNTNTQVGMLILTSPSMPNVDIIFIHNLAGNRINTFTHQTTQFFWPDALKTDIPNARITTFGYDDTPTKFFTMTQHDNSENHANELATALLEMRQNCRERPIVFIAHSLGGLILKQALVNCAAATYDLGLQDVANSTKGILFMGTPHDKGDLETCCSKLATQFENLDNANSTALITSLREKWEELADIQPRFQRHIKDIRRQVYTQVISFFEVSRVPDKKNLPTAPKGHGHSHCETIDTDHEGLVRFRGVDDVGYQLVLKTIRDILR